MWLPRGGRGLRRAIENWGLKPNYEFNWLVRQTHLIPHWSKRQGEMAEIRKSLHDHHSRDLLDFVSSISPKLNGEILGMDVLESYFSAQFIPRRAEGAIVIGGASVGEEIPFLNRFANSFRRVIMVEPSKGASSQLDTALRQSSLSNKSEIINAALGRDGGTTTLVGHGVSAQTTAAITADDPIIPIITIDSIAVEHPDVSFITLDVEGDELVALEGARKTIESSQPILAISVYHNPSDLFDVFEFLESTNVRYRYHLAALDFGLCDLTLYAIPASPMP